MRIAAELAEKGAGARRDALAAEAALAEARIECDRARERLRLFGVSEEGIERAARGEEIGAAIAIRAPFAGTILERNAAVGEAVEPGRALFVVADLSRVLLSLDLAEKEHALVEPGARVLFAPDGLPGEVFRGKLLARGAAVDPETRTIRALAEVKNPPRGASGRRLLVPGMFGRAEIAVREEEAALVVPREAVQWEGCHFVVFVEVREGLYQTRPVELGIAAGGAQEIRAGLLPGERVVTTGSYLLKTEILKGSIGAGCCD